jgi:hypothetical protein
MFFRQYELGCLSLYSYLVDDTTTGRAVVIDPQRDIGVYLADAAARELQIERVIETHFRADFVSGHLELARATGATVLYGPGAEADFPIANLADGQQLSLGEVVLAVRATTGHTPESVSIVVWEHHDDRSPWAVLSSNYALASMTEEAFVAAAIADQPLASTYLPFAASTNRRAHELLRAQGFAPVADVLGGFDACTAAGMPVAHRQS